MSKMTDLFIVDVDHTDNELTSRLSVEATFNQDCSNLSIDKIVDMDNHRVVPEHELTLQELQQLVAGVTKQVLNRYNLYGSSL